MRRIFIDTEWTAVPWSSASDLLWVGLADESGRSWCGLSSEARIASDNERYVSDLLQLITPDVPRLARTELATAIREFCDQVDEFWAWIPTVESFAAWSRLGEAASDVYGRCRDIDLQMLKTLVSPWPSTWPSNLQDLNAAAASASVSIPPRAANHLHPRVHAEWNRQLFKLINDATRASAA